MTEIAEMGLKAPELLAPCPFCGAMPDSLWRSTGNEYDPYEGYWSIDCPKCFHANCHADTEAAAITAWNTRAARPLDSRVTALVGALTYIAETSDDEHVARKAAEALASFNEGGPVAPLSHPRQDRDMTSTESGVML